MITFACTGADLAAAVTKPQATRVVIRTSNEDGVRYVDDLVQVELVYVNGMGQIVGDEANDYKPKDGEVAAWLLS